MKGGSRFANMMKYEAGKTYHVEAVLSTADRNIQVYVDGKRVGLRMFYAPVATIERIAFRTGEMRTFPTVDTPADQTLRFTQCRWAGTVSGISHLPM